MRILNPFNPAELLKKLHRSLRSRLRESTCQGVRTDLAQVAAQTAADTIYQIDRLSEDVILEWFRDNWPEDQPVEVVMEGLDEDQPTTYPKSLPVEKTLWKCLIDPIDGTRGLMYDKRSAWILTGLAPQHGPETTLDHVEVAVMTALPTSREWRSEQLIAIRGQGASASTENLLDGSTQSLPLQPSRARDCRHGFATVVRYFPEALTLLAEFEETLWQRLYPNLKGSPLEIFNDQYISSAGQLFELVCGHDRFIADLRPLAFRKLGLKQSLSTHPYDLAAMLVATEAGVLVEDPLTGKAPAPYMDTTTPVTWVGYANADLARHIRPVLEELIKEILL